MRDEPHDPWQVRNAGNQIIGEHEGSTRLSGALGKQVPGRVDEGSNNNEGERGVRHETSEPQGTRLVSTSPPLGFCPSGAATASPWCPQRSDQRRPRKITRNPSCHSVDGVHLPSRPPLLSSSLGNSGDETMPKLRVHAFAISIDG